MRTSKILICLLMIFLVITTSGLGQESQKPTGTGFVVDANGYLLTCQHVVKDAEKVEVGHAAGLSIRNPNKPAACPTWNKLAACVT